MKQSYTQPSQGWLNSFETHPNQYLFSWNVIQQNLLRLLFGKQLPGVLVNLSSPLISPTMFPVLVTVSSLLWFRAHRRE
jgi:hypothetical protein